MKAVVLCAGLGTRMRPLTDQIAKHLIPVANKPVLFYALENIVAAGIRDIGIVVNPATHPPIESAVSNGDRFGERIQYIDQRQPRGLAHAVKCARHFVGDEPFVLYLADTLIDEPVVRATALFKRTQSNAVVMLAAVPDPQRYGVAQVDAGRIVRLAEKSSHPPSNLAFIGACVLDHHIFDAIDRLQPSARGEYEITDAMQALVDRGLLVVPHLATSWWKDTGSPADLLDANGVLLSRIATDIRGTLDAASTVTGNAIIGTETRVLNSRVIGPVVIGDRVHIENATIGPFVAIGDRAHIRNVLVDDSIIMEGSTLDDGFARITRRVINAKTHLQVSA